MFTNELIHAAVVILQAIVYAIGIPFFFLPPPDSFLTGFETLGNAIAWSLTFLHTNASEAISDQIAWLVNIFLLLLPVIIVRRLWRPRTSDNMTMTQIGTDGYGHTFKRRTVMTKEHTNINKAGW